MIHLEGLTKRYKKADRNAVDGISFDVRAGEFFTLLGPNGAGKTTTISILTTTLTPSGGTATIDGHDIVSEASAVRRIVGIIFQRPSLDMNLTAEENVRFHVLDISVTSVSSCDDIAVRRRPPPFSREPRECQPRDART